MVVVAQWSKQFALPCVHKGLILGIPAHATRNSAQNRLLGSEKNRERSSAIKNAPNLASDWVLHSLTPGSALVKLSPRVILLNGKEPKMITCWLPVQWQLALTAKLTVWGGLLLENQLLPACWCSSREQEFLNLGWANNPFQTQG